MSVNVIVTVTSFLVLLFIPLRITSNLISSVNGCRPSYVKKNEPDSKYPIIGNFGFLITSLKVPAIDNVP